MVERRLDRLYSSTQQTFHANIDLLAVAGVLQHLADSNQHLRSASESDRVAVINCSSGIKKSRGIATGESWKSSGFPAQ